MIVGDKGPDVFFVVDFDIGAMVRSVTNYIYIKLIVGKFCIMFLFIECCGVFLVFFHGFLHMIFFL